MFCVGKNLSHVSDSPKAKYLLWNTITLDLNINKQNLNFHIEVSTDKFILNLWNWNDIRVLLAAASSVGWSVHSLDFLGDCSRECSNAEAIR
jgi:hypothetical protein